MENLDYFKEVCYIYQLRINLYKKRDSARFKLNYLRSIANAKVTDSDFVYSNRPVPKKYTNVSIDRLKRELLSKEEDLVKIKLKIKNHTKKYSSKLKKLTKGAGLSPVYRYGKITCLRSTFRTNEVVEPSEIKKYYDEYLMSRAIHKMLAE